MEIHKVINFRDEETYKNELQKALNYLTKDLQLKLEKNLSVKQDDDVIGTLKLYIDQKEDIIQNNFLIFIKKYNLLFNNFKQLDDKINNINKILESLKKQDVLNIERLNIESIKKQENAVVEESKTVLEENCDIQIYKIDCIEKIDDYVMPIQKINKKSKIKILIDKIKKLFNYEK